MSVLHARIWPRGNVSGLELTDGTHMSVLGCTDVIKRGRSWLGVDRRERWSSKGVDCDILAQGVI
jgi:hypothetical protein